MIVNSNIEQIHMDSPSQQQQQQQQQQHPPPSSISTTISTSSCTGISENFYLKRKHDELNDPTDNCNYIQPKKRLIQYQQHQQPQHQYTIIDENYQNLANSQSQHQQQQQQLHDTQNCDLQFNINNNNTNFINCHTIEFLNYDNLNSIPTATTTTVYTTSSPVTTTNTEHFDSNQWQTTTDLLELDQRYNTISHRFIDNKINTNDIHRNDDNIVYQQHDHQQQQQQQLQQNHLNIKTEDMHHQILQQDHQQQQHQHHQHQQSLIPLNIEQLNLNNQQQQSLRNKSIPKNSDQETDFEDKNLSWLFNFRLDELPHLSPDVQNNHNKNSASVPSILNNSLNINQQEQQQHQQQNKSINVNKLTQQSKTGKKVDELIKELTAEITEDGDMIVGENIIVENSLSPPRGPKKPPFTYTELIEYALEERGELTVSGIYQWISDRFPYYKSNDDRWKNSVRHNLSINPHFRKGLKAPQGAGHLWTISSRDSEENALAWEHKKQRLELFFKMEQLHNQRQQNSNQSEQNDNNNQQNYSVLDETTIAVQQITQQMQNDCTSDCRTADLNLNHSPLNNRTIVTTATPTIAGLPLANIVHSGCDLKKSAGEILNGIRRTVEVQPINCRTIGTYHESLLETEDYLNSIPKEEDIITHDGSFRSEFYVTEIDPIELGINITNVEEEVLFSEEFNLNYFGITSGNDIVA